MGSEVAPILLSMERRFAAAALLSAGLTPMLGKLPEVNAVNFLPRVKTPVLMVNGTYDSILPPATAQEPMFQQLGTATADKRRVVVDSGHSVMTPETQNTVIRRCSTGSTGIYSDPANSETPRPVFQVNADGDLELLNTEEFSVPARGH